MSETMAETLKPLSTYLLSNGFRVTLTIEAIEAIIQSKLPEEARQDHSWWEDQIQKADEGIAALIGWEITPHPTEQTIEFYSRWAEARRNDLADKFAVIVTLPHTTFEGQKIDGGSNFQGVYVFAAEFEKEVRQVVAEAFSPLLPPNELAELQGRPYEIGPAAQTWPMFAFVLSDVETVKTWLEFGLALAGSATLLTKLYGKMLQRRGIDPKQAPKVAITKPGLVSLCETHLRENYHPQAKITTEVEAFPGDYGYADENHPSGREQYRIRCRVSRKTYTFDINGHMEVSKFTMQKGSAIYDLKPPQFVHYLSESQPRS